MRIKINPDNNENWLNWGKLVNSWIDGATTPTTVGGLRDQMQVYGVTADIEGTDDRQVVIDMYTGPKDPLYLWLPNKQMRDNRLRDDIQPGIAGPYPLPLFYDIIFGGAARVQLSPQEKLDMAFRRIGEYTINECC